MSNFTKLFHVILMLLGSLLAQWFVNLIVVSSVSFMHFQLGHGLNVIDEWIRYYGWPLATSIKLLAVWSVFKWMSARQATSPRHLFSQIWGEANPESFVLTAFVVIAAIIIGVPKYNALKSLEFVLSLLHIACIVLFFLSDYLLIGALKKDGRFSNLTLFLSTLVMVFVVLMGNRYVYRIFNYHEDSMMVILLVSAVLCAWSQFTLKNVFVFLLCGLAPLVVILGVDPIHDVHFSFLELRRPLDGIFQLVIASLCLTYLIMKDKHRRLMMAPPEVYRL